MKALLPLLGLAAAGAFVASQSAKKAAQGGSSGAGGNTSGPLVVQPGGSVQPTNVGEWIVLETDGFEFQDVSVWNQETAELAPAKDYQLSTDPGTGDMLFTSNTPIKTVKFVIYAQIKDTDKKMAWTVDYSEVNEDDIPDLNSSGNVFNAQKAANGGNSYYMVAGGNTPRPSRNRPSGIERKRNPPAAQRIASSRVRRRF